MSSTTEPADNGGPYRKFSESEIPPPDFSVLVSMFTSQAAVALGLLPNPVTKKAELDLAVAKHFINMLTVLEEKTRGNLVEKETQMLTQALHQLRMAYVQKSKG